MKTIFESIKKDLLSGLIVFFLCLATCCMDSQNNAQREPVECEYAVYQQADVAEAYRLKKHEATQLPVQNNWRYDFIVSLSERAVRFYNNPGPPMAVLLQLFENEPVPASDKRLLKWQKLRL